ncbi:MAG: hypothetical protein HRF47_13765 [Chloroflexota bacterium]|jgi:hypothetical protein
MRFQPGALYITSGALYELGGGIIADAYQWHLRCDWSEMDPEDAEVNRLAVENGGRIFSAYQYGGRTVWVITEADRSATTVMLPVEY